MQKGQGSATRSCSPAVEFTLISTTLVSHVAAVAQKLQHLFARALKRLMGYGGRRIPVKAGEKYFIPKGVLHGGEPVAGTRTIHAFGGRRAFRAEE